MLFSARIAPAIIDTVLAHLALLFLAGAGGDLAAAREAAAQMLSGYNPGTPDELRLAAEIISFGFHALEALGQAADPDLAVTKVIRLRGSAVSLSREGHQAHRKLDQLQRSRRAEVAAQPVAAQPAVPAVAQPAAAQPAAAQPAAAQPRIDNARNNGQTWTQSFQKRQLANRIAENLRKNQLEHANSVTLPTSAENAAGAN